MNDESDFLEGEGARASSLKPVHKLSVRDPHHDLQLLRDLEIINARTEAELGKLPRGGVPVTPKRKPRISVPASPEPLRQGMRGDEVASLQARLAQLGYTDMLGKPLRADGLFGPITRLALQSFQHDSGLAADGIADGATVAASRRVVRERANQAAERIAVTSDRTYDVD